MCQRTDASVGRPIRLAAVQNRRAVGVVAQLMLDIYNDSAHWLSVLAGLFQPDLHQDADRVARSFDLFDFNANVHTSCQSNGHASAVA